MASGGDGETRRCAPASERPRSSREKARRRTTTTTPPQQSSAAAFLAQEDEYKRLNAELEAKTAELVRQAEEVMREQQEVLSKPIPTQVELFDEEAKCQRDLHSPELAVLPLALNKQPNKKKPGLVSAARTRPLSGKKGRGTSCALRRLPDTQSAADVAVPDFCLAKTIAKIEGQLEGGDLPDVEDDIIPGAGSEIGAEAQVRFLKAKLRVMQEELDTLGQEYQRKEDENQSLGSRLKDAEAEHGRLQRTGTLQQSQLEKYKTLSEEATRRSEGLQHQLSALGKELENLKRAQKQAAASQSTMEVRLNRALEEAERYKTELNKVKQSNKDVVNQEHRRLEELKIENKRLEKQKGELLAGFKKQLKLIDILKRQKMHIEAAKMLSFTEEEFMKALEWGNS